MIPEEGLQDAWPSEPAGPPPEPRPRLALLKELPVLVLIAFGIALLMKTFLLQMFFIPSASMEPTLHGCRPPCVGDRVAVNKFAYRFREPARGEVIVFVAREDERQRSFLQQVRDFLTDGLGVTRPEEDDFIKRVIALPGERIRVTGRNVIVTTTEGERLRLREDYIQLEGANLRTFGPFRVPEDSYFVMGDNRNNSSDSRSSLGPIHRSRIIGKAFVKIWPPSRIGTLEVPSYEDTVGTDAAGSDPRVPSRPGPDPVMLLPVAFLPLVASTRMGRRGWMLLGRAAVGS